MKLKHSIVPIACIASLAIFLTCYFGARLITQPHEGEKVATVVELPPPLPVTHDAPTTAEPETPVVDHMADIEKIYRAADEEEQKLMKTIQSYDELEHETEQTFVELAQLFKEMGLHEEAAEVQRMHEASSNIHVEKLPPEVVENMDVEYVFRELELDTSALRRDQ